MGMPRERSQRLQRPSDTSFTSARRPPALSAPGAFACLGPGPGTPRRPPGKRPTGGGTAGGGAQLPDAGSIG
ncbi:MAG: hypothetical protein QOC85_501 [Streptomyces sp.]|jgi:hypothetical protein|nr:hypothetical protein [Streptomyces sp.]